MPHWKYEPKIHPSPRPSPLRRGEGGSFAAGDLSETHTYYHYAHVALRTDLRSAQGKRIRAAGGAREAAGSANGIHQCTGARASRASLPAPSYCCPTRPGSPGEPTAPPEPGSDRLAVGN